MEAGPSDACWSVSSALKKAVKKPINVEFKNTRNGAK
jgi:hypothetical protein